MSYFLKIRKLWNRRYSLKLIKGFLNNRKQKVIINQTEKYLNENIGGHRELYSDQVQLNNQRNNNSHLLNKTDCNMCTQM